MYIKCLVKLSDTEETKKILICILLLFLNLAINKHIQYTIYLKIHICIYLYVWTVIKICQNINKSCF